MSSKQTRYDEQFKKTLVTLCKNGRSQSSVCQEYVISSNTLCGWIKQYSTVETEDGDVLTAKQVKELQLKMAQLEEENQILKKAIAIYIVRQENANKKYRISNYKENCGNVITTTMYLRRTFHIFYQGIWHLKMPFLFCSN